MSLIHIRLDDDPAPSILPQEFSDAVNIRTYRVALDAQKMAEHSIAGDHHATAGNECWECGAADVELHEHHVVGRGFGGKKTLPLCGRCHGFAHITRSSELLASLSKEKLDEARKAYRVDQKVFRRLCRDNGIKPYNDNEMTRIRYKIERMQNIIRVLEDQNDFHDMPKDHLKNLRRFVDELGRSLA